MQKKIWIIGGVVLLLAAVGIAAILYLGGEPRIKDLNTFIPVASPKPDQQSELIITEKDNVTSILPNTQYKGRMPFYLDENRLDAYFYFMYYYSDRKSIFYSFDTTQSDTEHPYQKIFEVDGNVESGEVVNEGNGLVYRDMVNESYMEGSLRYLKKDGAAATILRNCIYYSVSPDKKRMIAGGNDPQNPGQEEKSFFIYDFTTEKLIRLEQVFCPQSLEDLIGVETSWNHNSRYICLIDKVIDAESGGVIKKNFASNDNTVLTSFRWSPDGQRLAFLSQSDSNSGYSIDENNISICLSDRIGIYNTWDGSIRYIEIRDGLAVDYIWADDNKSIVVKTVALENADAFISNYQPDSATRANPEKFDLFQIDTDKQVLTEFFQDYPVRSLHQLSKGKLLYTYLKNNSSFIAIYDTKTKTTKNLFGGSTLTPYRYQNKLLIAVSQGVYLIDDTLKTKKMFKWDQSYPLVLLPEQEIAAYNKNDRIVVASLKGKI